MAACRHCGRKANRPRGLCWTCYYTPAVSDRYPSTSKFCTHKPEELLACLGPAAWPTAAPPGSREKVAVLSDRAGDRLELWHALDFAIPD